MNQFNEKVVPDYREEARALYALARRTNDADAELLIASKLGKAFAEGGIKALDLVKEGLGL